MYFSDDALRKLLSIRLNTNLHFNVWVLFFTKSSQSWQIEYFVHNFIWNVKIALMRHFKYALKLWRYIRHANQFFVFLSIPIEEQWHHGSILYRTHKHFTNIYLTLYVFIIKTLSLSLFLNNLRNDLGHWGLHQPCQWCELTGLNID